MKIVTWNVNGLRARIKAGFEKTIAELQPDILCIQETRAKPEQLPASVLKQCNSYFSIHNKPGYAGATTLIYNDDISPLRPILHLDDFPENDEPGRVSILDFKEFKLINAYVPNSGQRLERLDHRVAWQEKLAEYIAAQVKPVIYCGDLNCAHQKIDVGSPTIKSGVSVSERTAFQNILDIGLVDVFRHLNPTKVEYTWFSTQYASKAVNRGMRIDSFIISQELLPNIVSIQQVQDDTLIAGSDHVPVILEINI